MPNTNNLLLALEALHAGRLEEYRTRVQLLSEEELSAVVDEEKGWNLMHFAAEAGVEFVKVALDLGLGCLCTVADKSGQTSAQIASSRGDVESARRLLEEESGASPILPLPPQLAAAVRNLKSGDVVGFRHHIPNVLAKDLETKIDAVGNRVMYLAASHGEEAVAAALRRGCYVTVPNRHGDTPLHAAARLGDYKSLQRMTESEKVNCLELRNGHGYTLIHYSILAESLESFQALASLRGWYCANLKGNTPLHLAVQKSSPGFVEKLAEYLVKNLSVSIREELKKGDALEIEQII